VDDRIQPLPDPPPPWEWPGAVRRDVMPHRGNWLRALGTAAAVCGFLSLCTGLTALAAVPLAIAAYELARHDLARMHAGLMDPAGREDAEAARAWAVLGLLFSLPGILVSLLVFSALLR
jgi:hypothetical protein